MRQESRGVAGAHVQSYWFAPLAKSAHSKLDQMLHVMASSVDPIHQLVGSFTCLFGLNYFQPCS